MEINMEKIQYLVWSIIMFISSIYEFYNHYIYIGVVFLIFGIWGLLNVICKEWIKKLIGSIKNLFTRKETSNEERTLV